MLLRSFELKEGNFFIAMEYYGLILNRTFVVIILNDRLIGLKVSGAISAEGGHNPFTIAATRALAVKGDLQNPFAYVKQKYTRQLLDEDILGSAILKVDSANFEIFKRDIIEVTYDARKKWGMGPYPHDGKVYVKTAGKTREFIILGAQSGEDIRRWILGDKKAKMDFAVTV
ncbi:hypothetical protein [Mucilaginibacter ginsenosidivorax]|uniref:Uncharacterized protein n=1 Tax=Mucilaginibacter ginsenosidivorax TaxID=862126 RepID=A0A5B8W0J2_9SPHI|nr:hypothetical protein [Mucilaginibacter ginsenosidivorax]QEC76296.1 hypothetical protein FSB76_10195 [Mucilaginibacter ginsenosidivorax]